MADMAAIVGSSVFAMKSFGKPGISAGSGRPDDSIAWACAIAALINDSLSSMYRPSSGIPVIYDNSITNFVNISEKGPYFAIYSRSVTLSEHMTLVLRLLAFRATKVDDEHVALTVEHDVTSSKIVVSDTCFVHLEYKLIQLGHYLFAV